MTSTMSSGTKLVKQDKITYWMDPNEHLSGTSVNDVHASKLTTSWNNATLTNATHSSDNQGVYSMSSGGKIQFPTSTSNNPFRTLWLPNSGTLNKTVSAWVYCTSSEAVDIFQTDTSGTTYYDVTWKFRVESNGKLRMYLYRIPSGVNNSAYWESTNSIVDYDAWTYITMTTQDNGLSGNQRWMNFKFYKNGVLVDDSPTKTTIGSNNTFRANPAESWYMSGVNITRLFVGDDHKAGPLYVHDVTLTAAEIKRNYMQHKSRFQEM